MAGPRVKGTWRVVLLLIAAVVVWIVDQRRGGGGNSNRNHGENSKPPVPRSAPASPEATGGNGGKGPATAARDGRYERFDGCRLEEHRQNDGDSFRVQLPDGRSETFRLYFVDCPESAFRSYAGGETNHQRIREQADYFGITPEEAVEIGQQAKKFTLAQLQRRPFSLFTEWDDPYGDQRYHALIPYGDGGWLHQELVRQGLVRIRTKPAELPDGTPAKAEVARLRELEAAAKAARRGAWKLSRS